MALVFKSNREGVGGTIFFEQFVAAPLLRLHLKRIVNGTTTLPWAERTELSAGSDADAHSSYRAVDNPFTGQAYQQKTKRKKPNKFAVGTIPAPGLAILSRRR